MNYLRQAGALLLVAILLACAWLQPLDAPAAAQVDSGLNRALATYATARLLHGAVSVLQGTQIDAAPAGIGATFSPGQILAPAAEILKQFSDVMLLVCISFGIQKLLITMGGGAYLSLALTLVGIGWAYQVKRQRDSPKWLTSAFILLVLVRFAIPLTVIGSDYLFHSYMQQDYKQSQEAISAASAHVIQATSPELAEPNVAGNTTGKNGSIAEKNRSGLLERLGVVDDNYLGRLTTTMLAG